MSRYAIENLFGIQGLNIAWYGVIIGFVNQEAFGNLVTAPHLQFFPYAVYIDTLAECFMKQEYCLVIIEFDSHEGPGLELLHTMRATKNTPILVLANYLGSEAKIALCYENIQQGHAP